MTKTTNMSVTERSSSCHASPSLLARLRNRLSLALQLLQYRLLIYLTNHPVPLRAYFSYLRRMRPIAVGRNIAFVTRHADVRDVLARSQDFLISELTAGKMLGGPFLLSADWREQHSRERGTLEEARGDAARDVQRIRRIAARRSAELIAQARRNGGAPYSLDVASGFSEEVAAAVVREYLGVPVDDEVVQWLRILASVIVTDPPAGSSARQEAERVASRFSDHVQREVADCFARTSGTTIGPDDDFLTRLVKMSKKRRPSRPWLDDDWVRRFIYGLAVFGNATVARSTTNAFDRLLAKPRILQDAQALASDLDEAIGVLETAKQDETLSSTTRRQAAENVDHLSEVLRAYVYEALRFRPMLPLLGRFSPRETIVGLDERVARKIPGGHTVIAAPLAAMFDPVVFDKPWQFRVNRPMRAYLHFGHGPHICFAQYVADAQILEMFHALLRLENVRRAGRLRFDGPAVQSLWIRFD